MALSYLLGPRHPSKVKLNAYECGIEPTGDARQRFSVKFFLVAMVFILFDVEVIFLYPWAVTFFKLGLIGLIEMLIFIALFVVAYVYAWKKGALEWD